MKVGDLVEIVSKGYPAHVGSVGYIDQINDEYIWFVSLDGNGQGQVRIADVKLNTSESVKQLYNAHLLRIQEEDRKMMEYSDKKNAEIKARTLEVAEELNVPVELVKTILDKFYYIHECDY